MSYRWQLTVYLIVLWVSVCVDGRFRRLSSGLYGSSSLPSGGWRLMKPNELLTDYSGSNGNHVGPSLPSSSLTSSLFNNNQRHQTINPTIHTNHWRLPFQSNHNRFNNHLDSSDSTEYDLESTIAKNQPSNNLDQQQQSRLIDIHPERLLIEPADETTEKDRQTFTLSSIGSSNVPRPQLDEVKFKSGSPESLLGEEISSRSTSSNLIHYASKKAESESAHVGNPLIQYRSFNPGNRQSGSSFSDLYFVAIVVGSSGIAIFAVIGAGYCFYRFQQHNKSAADIDYPAYGVVGPITKETSGNSGNISPIGDRKLAQSAQMYHYHHQKQQMIASEKGAASRHTSASDVDSEEENEEGDYTVYECPGLASTGEMEVKNPLFQDDITPVSSPSIVTNGGDSKDKK